MDVYAIGVALEFSSSARKVLGETASAADAAAEATERLTASMLTAQTATRSFLASQRAFQRSLGVSATAVEAAQARIDAAFGTMRDTAVTSMDDAAAATRTAAGSIDASTRSMTRRFGAVAGSARRATIAVTDLAAASKAVTGGVAIPRPGGGASVAGPAMFAGGPMAFAASKVLGTVKWAGLAAAGMGIDAIHEAAEFQTSMTSIANITGANFDQMQRIRAQMFGLGDQTAMSPNQVASMFREEARMSQGAMSVNAMQTLLPLLAKAQVVMGSTRGYSPQQTVDAMMSYVHLMRLYDPKNMPGGFDLATRLFELAPTAPASVVRQLSYFVPQLKSLGVPDAQQDALMLTLARAGYGQGKGGTGLAALVMQALGPLQITSFQQGIKEHLLQTTGLTDRNRISRFFNDRAGGNIIGMLQELERYRHDVGNLKATQTFQSMFGTQGARIANLLANPVVAQQLTASQKALTGQESLGLESQFEKFMQTFGKQSLRAWNNFQATMTELGSLIMPAATLAATDFGNTMHDAQVWLHQNKDAEHAFMQALLGDVKLVASTIDAHRQDFAAIGGNLAFFGREVNTLGRAAVLAVGPLTTLARIVTDIATGNVGDVGTMVSEFRERNVATQIGQLRDHTARVNAWRDYIHQFGVTGIPTSVLNAVFPAVKGGGDWGPPTTGAHPATPPAGSSVPSWMHGPMPSASGLNVVRPIMDRTREVAKVTAHFAHGAAVMGVAIEPKTGARKTTRSRATEHVVSAQPISKGRKSAAGHAPSDGDSHIHFHGDVHMKVDGADAKRAHQSIIAAAHDLAERHLPKSHPLKPGLGGSGFTLGDALLA